MNTSFALAIWNMAIVIVGFALREDFNVYKIKDQNVNPFLSSWTEKIYQVIPDIYPV